jgi:hypothetical protein
MLVIRLILLVYSSSSPPPPSPQPPQLVAQLAPSLHAVPMTVFAVLQRVQEARKLKSIISKERERFAHAARGTIRE